ncbi:AraC family transcriptional regulator [Paenibacillus sp. KQZ6P-2]|uniref:AraC family transcriptional regulator n=1 Tax=Paenibacillus mangrovi TaxID=2931978 RepID=A0A9X1WUA4_9BACL|nr:AraC family transcriptional regulator [Paenibacillus mangrovi]MCJ8014721.1 AraC family transcriptional regulator [Paenibacillus mangrovi]
MTYPPELRERTYFNDPTYPMNIFHNHVNTPYHGAPALHMHWHEHLEIIFMTQGQAVFHIDSMPYEAEPGDIIMIPPGALHVGYSACAESLDYIAIVFNASLFKHIASDPIHSLYIAPYLDGTLRFPFKISHDDSANGHFRSILRQIINEFTSRHQGYELIVRSQMYILLTLLSRKFMPKQQTEKTSRGHARNAERFKKLLLYIDDHYTETITVSQAASIVNLNPYHFCKIFKKTTGSTLIEYINLNRIHAAERLLKESDHSITEIAEQIGLGNPNYFTKLFKQYNGVSPSQWRKEFSSN